MTRKVDADVLKLIEISRAVGSDERLVQAGGGNTSVKDARGSVMHIKASGTGLKDMAPGRGWVTMRMKPLLELLENRKVAALPDAQREPLVLDAMYAAVADGPDTAARPSCEASLHAMLERYVVHIHPISVNGVLCSRQSKKLCEEMAARCGFTMVWTPYSNPGHPLAVLCRNEVKKFKARHKKLPEVLFLEDHGLFVSSRSADRAVDLTKAIVAECETLYQSRPPVLARGGQAALSEDEVLSTIVELRRELGRRGCDSRYIQFVPDETAQRLLSRSDGQEILKINNTPDGVVYCLAYPLFAQATPSATVTALGLYIDEHREPPRTVLLPGQGFLVVGDSEKGLKTTTVVYKAQLEVLERTLRFGGPKPFTQAQAGYINTWEVEAYRRKLAKAEAGAAGPLTGKVALVTGAGSGLGRGIALGLAAAGAHVVLADIDQAGAVETMGLIKERCHAPRAAVMVTDVTSEESMAAAFGRTVLGFGGIDIVVAAAGIAPAYPIADFPVAAFRKTLEINLTGYFLAGREAARWMIRQQTGGSLIFISSKTGLEASRNNAAYNVTKSGELQLMRGLALELGKHQIRSNAICPGNVFEGSKIWNPEYIKEAARKRGLKPEEVIPHYISMTALGQEIKQEDVANAAVFLASDMARVITGQALVVDGGQVFAR
jgi:NAD(P)-dependent dehydrogenase (short-subunit alcohol dehydrogenase family)/rhamnose utilization protein RhaD (predicted bifunctional aldolase and dehydrogenase)